MKKELISHKVYLFTLTLVSVLFLIHNAITEFRPNSDQLVTISFALKYNDPSLFSRDVFFNYSYNNYAKGYIILLGSFMRLLGDQRLAHLCLSAILNSFFLFSMYALLFDATHDKKVSVCVGVAAILFRASFGGTYWGLGGLRSVQARSVVLAILPMLILLFFKWYDSFKLMFVFLLTGIMALMHPPSSLYLAMILGVVMFLASGLSRTNFKRLALAFFSYFLGSLPYLWSYIQGERMMPMIMIPSRYGNYQTAVLELPSVFYTFPPPFKTIRWVSFYALIPLCLAVAGIYWRKKELGFDHRDKLWQSFTIGVLFISFGGIVVARRGRK